jgi:hypothetical protein
VINLGGLLTRATDPVLHDPGLAPLRQAVRGGDWPAVAAYFAGLPARADQGPAVAFVAAQRASENFLQRTVDTERDSSLARTLLGARLITLAWRARSSYGAQHVSRAQWQLFHERLCEAERVLADATALDRGNAAAWTMRLTTARGLNFGIDEGRRRYGLAAEHCDVPYHAQELLLQHLCPKWDGTLEDLHAFARQCLADSPAGSLSGAAVAIAHIEHAFHTAQGGLYPYLAQDRVRQELRDAAQASVLHPDYRPAPGWVAAHTAFAFAFYQGGGLADAAPHFAALGRCTTAYPWQMWSADPVKAFRTARRAVKG